MSSPKLQIHYSASNFGVSNWNTTEETEIHDKKEREYVFTELVTKAIANNFVPT